MSGIRPSSPRDAPARRLEVESVVVRDRDQRDGDVEQRSGEPRRPVEQLARGRVVHVEAADAESAPARTPRGVKGAVACAKRVALSWTACPRGMCFRAALRLQPLVGQRLEVESPHPRAGDRGRLEGRRSRARVGRGGGQEPAAALRRRPRRPEPSADDGALADRTARQARTGCRGSCCAAKRSRACSGTGRC